MDLMKSCVRAGLVLAAAGMIAGAAARAEEPTKTVYHLPDERQATLAMNNVANQLAADPQAKIVVVALSTGVRAFLFGAQDAGGRPFSEWVETLGAKGVEFRMCLNSMNALQLGKQDFVDGLQFVPSGVAEIVRLQVREGYAYIRP
ncbi:MAG TPA: DsrE family protein [Burkholderiales bacterium]|nr:DsrE family protein [Burkholderiales bacterium]